MMNIRLSDAAELADQSWFAPLPFSPMRAEGTAVTNELLDSLRHESDWRQMLQYGEQRARELGIGPEDVISLVEGVPGRD